MTTTTMADLLMAAPSVSDARGKSVLMTDSNGNLNKIPSLGFVQTATSNSPSSPCGAGWIRVACLGLQKQSINFVGSIVVQTFWNSSAPRTLLICMSLISAKWGWYADLERAVETFQVNVVLNNSPFQKGRIIVEKSGGVGDIYLELYTETTNPDYLKPNLLASSLIGDIKPLVAANVSAPTGSPVFEFNIS